MNLKNGVYLLFQKYLLVEMINMMCLPLEAETEGSNPLKLLPLQSTDRTVGFPQLRIRYFPVNHRQCWTKIHLNSLQKIFGLRICNMYITNHANIGRVLSFLLCFTTIFERDSAILCLRVANFPTDICLSPCRRIRDDEAPFPHVTGDTS